MKEYKNLVIGFGKAGKTLAGLLAKKGEKTVLIEKSKKMYGGTCINVACIPSKSLEYSARLSQKVGGSFEVREQNYAKAIEEKRRLVTMLRQKNYEKVSQAGAEILDGEVSFISENTVEVKYEDGTKESIKAERIFINTGSKSIIPNIEGLKDNPYVYTSESLMELDKLPNHLVINGGGYIGLEFASYYANFGSKVTIIQNTEKFIPREDEEVSSKVFESMTQRGIEILKSAQTTKIDKDAEKAIVYVKVLEKEQEIKCDAVLIATGREANIDSLNLDKAGIELTDRKTIKVDKHLRTGVKNIWAMGDVAGSLQFTYISLDDFRIVKSELFGNAERTTENRGAIPYTVFIDPPLSRVGLTEEEARQKGYNVKVASLPTGAVPKAQVYRQPVGILKAIINNDNDEILGVHLFCPESQEMINLIKMAIDHGIKASELGSAIYTHPTMSEAFNDLLS